MFIKLPDEVCVIRRKRSLKIRQFDKICCCVLLTSTYLKNASRCGRFKKKEGRGEGKGTPEREGEKL